LINFLRPRQQGVADEAITIWRGGIDGQQQRPVSLVHLVDAQDAGEVGDDPRLVIDDKVDLGGLGAAPKADHFFVGLDPEISRQLIRHAPHGKAVAVHRADGFLYDASRVNGTRSQKGRLRPGTYGCKLSTHARSP